MGKSSELFASWKAWAERNGQPARDSKHFREELERLGFPWKRANDANYYAGLFVRPPPTSPDGAGGAWEVR
jgi:phage/plasmid-associated DNA primase